jgi:histidinol-phosphate aminotransferase
MRESRHGIRSNVLNMEPYQPGRPIEDVKREYGLKHVVKLASNENPLGPSPKAVEALRRAAGEMHLYPDGASRALREAISARFGVPYDQVLVGNGSDELIHLLGLLFLGRPDDEMIVGNPSFTRYDASAFLAPAKLHYIPLDADLKFDLDAMAAAVTPNTRLIFIANPNNPTGTVVERAEFERFLDRLPEHLPVVLDEAYVEFAEPHFDVPRSQDYVLEGRPVIGLRTFSKAFGLAGLRVGWAFVPHEVADAFHRAREPFNVNRLGQVAAIAALHDDDHIARTVANNSAGLRRLNAILEQHEGRPYRSGANFAYANLRRPAQPVFEQLMRRGVIVRSGHHVGHPDCLRVSVGTPDEIAVFEEQFGIVMNELTARV